ncbi:helix-turn-helix domain-containing protein [Euzebya sp.]|uniref:helix-turn-helix domain-containing protein n=1 Tax=Euzebya sp. TaxID=1971409 RepID=UPI00351351CD
MAPIDHDRLWTVAEVAEHMRVSNMTVYRLIKAGDLPAIRVGKNYRIRGKELADYIDRSFQQVARDARPPGEAQSQ